MRLRTYKVGRSFEEKKPFKVIRKERNARGADEVVWSADFWNGASYDRQVWKSGVAELYNKQLAFGYKLDIIKALGM